MKDNSHTWHQVTDKEKEQITLETTQLLETFSRKLVNMQGTEEHFASSVSPNGIRDTGTPWTTDEEFRTHFFANAPLVEDEFIKTNKGSWKK